CWRLKQAPHLVLSRMRFDLFSVLTAPQTVRMLGLLSLCWAESRSFYRPRCVTTPLKYCGDINGLALVKLTDDARSNRFDGNVIAGAIRAVVHGNHLARDIQICDGALKH